MISKDADFFIEIHTYNLTRADFLNNTILIMDYFDIGIVMSRPIFQFVKYLGLFVFGHQRFAG